MNTLLSDSHILTAMSGIYLLTCAISLNYLCHSKLLYQNHIGRPATISGAPYPLTHASTLTVTRRHWLSPSGPAGVTHVTRAGATSVTWRLVTCRQIERDKSDLSVTVIQLRERLEEAEAGVDGQVRKSRASLNGESLLCFVSCRPSIMMLWTSRCLCGLDQSVGKKEQSIAGEDRLFAGLWIPEVSI